MEPLHPLVEPPQDKGSGDGMLAVLRDLVWSVFRNLTISKGVVLDAGSLLNQKGEHKMAWHPSGPNLPGHPVCGKGMIYSHDKHRCISVVSAKPGDDKRKTSVGGVIREA